jgi:hypothetical protein
MKKLIEIVKQFLGLGKTAKAITTVTQLNNEVKEAIVEVKEKVEEVKKKTRYYSKPKSKPSVETTTEKKSKKPNKPKQQ